MNHKLVGSYLKNVRMDKGLTQSDVAVKLGYTSPQFISNIERGISKVPLKTLRHFIDLYQLNPEHLIETILEEKRHQIRKALGV